MPAQIIITYGRAQDSERANYLAQRFQKLSYKVECYMIPDATSIQATIEGRTISFDQAGEFASQEAEKTVVEIVMLENGEGLPVPAYETAGAAGMDLRAAISEGETVFLDPGDRVLIPCGISIALPKNVEAQVRPRSGLAWKHGITVLNSPGTIDCDYRGEVMAMLINHGSEAFEIKRGDRVAQMVINRVEQARFHVVKSLSETSRGAGGFGSTGV